jgi:hypothetical protein
MLHEILCQCSDLTGGDVALIMMMRQESVCVTTSHITVIHIDSISSKEGYQRLSKLTTVQDKLYRETGLV